MGTAMPKLSAVPAPLTSLPTAAPMALPNTGYGFPHGAMFGIQNGKVPKGGYTNVAEPKNVNPYNPGTQYDAYANAMASYKYYQNSPYTGLHPSQVPITHVKDKAFGVVPAPLFPGKVWAKGTADGKVAYFNSDPASTEAVHSWPAYGKHSQAQTNQILQTRYLAENQKVGTLAVNGLAHAVSANIAQNQEHNKMQAKALEQILKETEEQKAAVAEALAQVEKRRKPKRLSRTLRRRLRSSPPMISPLRRSPLRRSLPRSSPPRSSLLRSSPPRSNHLRRSLPRKRRTPRLWRRKTPRPRRRRVPRLWRRKTARPR